MDQSINPTGCRYRSRCRCKEQRIQKRISRDQFIRKYRKFVISLMICDHGKSCNFRTGSCCCGNGDQWNDLTRNLVCAFIFCDTSAIFCHNTYGFCHIHGRTASKCNNKICPAYLKCFRCPFHSLYRWISFRVAESTDCDACLYQDFLTLPDYTKSVQCGTGNDKTMFSSKLPGCPGKLF